MLISETFNDPSICFSFWYHAFGNSIGNLRIYLADANSSNRILSWEISGQQSSDKKDWKQGVLPLNNINYDYKIIIEGTIGVASTGTSINGDIA